MSLDVLNARLTERWSSGDRTINIGEYELLLNESQDESKKFSVRYAGIGIFSFCAGLWALSEQSTFITVFLLACSAFCFHEVSDALQIIRIMDKQRWLAMLINKPC